MITNHRFAQGDLYGHVLGVELLEAFKSSYGERLLTLQLANVEGVEDTFRGFNSQIRPAVKGSIRPLMQICTLTVKGERDEIPN